MGNTVAVVDISTSLEPWTEKYARRLAGKPLIEWVVRQITDCQLIEQVVVVAGKSKAESSVARLVPSNVRVIRSARKGSVSRCAEVVRATGCDAIVRIVCHGPFLDPQWIDRLVAAADGDVEYVSYCCSEGKPSLLRSAGFFAEWCKASLLDQIERGASLPDEREEIARYLFTRPGKHQLCMLPVPAEVDRDDVRVKIDSEEDWEHAQVIFEAVGADEPSWARVAELLAHQPSLRRRMAALNNEEARAVSPGV